MVSDLVLATSNMPQKDSGIGILTQMSLGPYPEAFQFRAGGFFQQLGGIGGLVAEA